MVSVPEIPAGQTEKCLARDRRREGTPLRALKMCLGSALLVASLGLWFVSAGPQDAAMQLIRLLLSLTLLALGLAFISALDHGAEPPEVHVDPRHRQLRILANDSAGRLRLRAVHDLDSLAEVSLAEGRLRALDAAGEVVVDLPLPDPGDAARVAAALRGTA